MPDDWIDGLQFSLDYFTIDLRDGIRGGYAQEALDQCFNGVQAFCDMIEFGTPDARYPDNARSNVVGLRAPYVNDVPYKSSGVDIAVNYSFGLDELVGVPGEVSMRLMSTYMIETLIGRNRLDVAGQTGGEQGFLSDFATAPEWASNLIVSYAYDAFSLTAQARYTGEGVLDLQTPKIGPNDAGYDPGMTRTVSDNTVPSHTVWNLSAGYELLLRNSTVQLFANIDNVFDRDPPFAAGSTGGANPMFFDAMGRTYRFGLRASF